MCATATPELSRCFDGNKLIKQIKTLNFQTKNGFLPKDKVRLVGNVVCFIKIPGVCLPYVEEGENTSRRFVFSLVPATRTYSRVGKNEKQTKKKNSWKATKEEEKKTLRNHRASNTNQLERVHT